MAPLFQSSEVAMFITVIMLPFSPVGDATHVFYSRGCDLSPRIFSYIDMNNLEHDHADHVLGQKKKSIRNLALDYM